MTEVQATDLQITNENYKEVGQAIADLLFKAFGGGSFQWNFSKSHGNCHGCEQSYKLSFPKFKFLSFSWNINTIHYDGQWYKGYYRKRGVSLFNFKLKTQDVEINPAEMQDYINELRQAVVFLEGLAEIETSVSPMKPDEAGWDEFPQSNNYVEFSA